MKLSEVDQYYWGYTKKFKGEAYLCNLASEVIEENKIK